MTNALAWLCSCQWQTFWTNSVTISLFSLYLMNFMIHTMLDAACNIQRVHYKSMKYDVFIFTQGSSRTNLHVLGLGLEVLVVEAYFNSLNNVTGYRHGTVRGSAWTLLAGLWRSIMWGWRTKATTSVSLTPPLNRLSRRLTPTSMSKVSFVWFVY